jgi:cell division protein FtsN
MAGAKDYKKLPARRRGGSGGMTGTQGLMVGLGIGLAIAAGVWQFKSRPAPAPAATEAKKPAPMSAREESADQEPPPNATDYTFYDRLKNFEVVIPEKEKDVHRDLKPAPETRPGTYVLQAGSYRNFADADRIRAQLALQGVESKVQKVTIDADTWHRVRIGPITNLNDLNRIRTRLRQAEIDALVIRVGD